MNRRFESYLGQTFEYNAPVNKNKLDKLKIYGAIALAPVAVALLGSIVSPETAAGVKSLLQDVGSSVGTFFSETLPKKEFLIGLGLLSVAAVATLKSRIFYDKVPMNSIYYYEHVFNGMWREHPTQVAVYGPARFGRFPFYKKLPGNLDGNRSLGNRVLIEGLRVAGETADGNSQQVNFDVPATFDYEVPPSRALYARRIAAQAGEQNGNGVEGKKMSELPSSILRGLGARVLDANLSSMYAHLSAGDSREIDLRKVLDQDDRPVVEKKLQAVMNTYQELVQLSDPDSALKQIAKIDPVRAGWLRNLLSLPQIITRVALENAVLPRTVTQAQNEMVEIEVQRRGHGGLGQMVAKNMADSFSTSLEIAAQSGGLPATLSGLDGATREILAMFSNNNSSALAGGGGVISGPKPDLPDQDAPFSQRNLNTALTVVGMQKRQQK